ncbi:menaquinone-dependent protoporphyrinogen IX dehydrogenase [Reinekea marinisedimentorum]|uniref:Protoporphyrinogen IX dehydrogenase [quinone] n=1 Tax=Reinekea marinisedimentorum TaxID=230495 RepID=A0A4R3I956_9GAMM|nr:menaquinone-dependent protoporphyrinogen IX dehydrogenase [Reinekea marinisedimentorum]TCS42684.1 menaquinone-dependent protoporphyrinogen oxidase [Reinekea marinisedimentorum]
MLTLIIYATVDGQTKKIAETIARDWQGEVDVIPFQEFETYPRRDQVSCMVIGSSIRYGHYNKELIELIKRNRDWLASIDSSFFSVNLTARKPGKSDPANSPYVQKFLKRTGWVPDHIAMFAGQLAYPKYRFIDKQMIRFIMKITGGCTDGVSTIEYTDWNEVARFAKTISGLSSKKRSG